MILLIDMTHLDFSENKPENWQSVAHRRLRTKYRFEELSGEPCHILRYTQFLAWSRGQYPISGVSRLVFSGFNTEFDQYPADVLDSIKAWMLSARLPTFTICGSFQLMAHAHGAEIAPIGPAPGDSPKHNDPIVPQGMTAELGFLSVQDHQPSKLFDRERPQFTVFQHHYWEVKDIPDGFRHTASSPVCYIQALEHNTLPLAGVQFHPEDYDDTHPDGKTLLMNVFKKR
ncbi:MAG: gamma-glutamyl-gamma-aminobutyrate hydrolase family protein [Verrucomicrobiota bacterium]